MAARTLTQPDNSTQTGASYKGNIDDAIAVLAQIADQFAAHAKASPDLNALVDAGRMLVAGALVSQNQQTVSGFVAAGATQRIDRIVGDLVTGAATRVAGVESGSPVAPAVPAGKFPIAQVGPFSTSTTAVTNAMITDERVLVVPASGDASFTTLTVSGLITANGGQIAFPASQNASAGANTLDDYEEGTWTPSVGGTATYTIQDGRYTKIGNVVHLHVCVQINVIGTGSTTGISGLPFTNITRHGGLAIGDWATSATNIVSLYAKVAASAATMEMRSATAAGASLVANAFFGSGSFVSMSGTHTT